ncbi:YbaB/EbfC family nucleoid-associated protein [candidate division KSB3 bacterium]|uniref:Nucleoid-associated protein CSB45_10665 n=1 Tax=candidate division KSB3 bacterium TaxID=2044937 RepID=A0A2G6E4J0_9BACT|nr:MAG: YbaB/EbfC family nucleoid-associated protein [candidate division KSB3 bacterium]PIE29211.1 MAG: YbaB/EbfC family nucleoid-associated protein [candidate division KSB3 bacterium]
MGNLMKQVQEMQTKLAEIEEELIGISVEGQAGGGMVTVIANGKQQIQEVRIEAELINTDEHEMLQDLIVAATNQALEASQSLRSEKISALTGGLNLPNIPGLTT